MTALTSRWLELPVTNLAVGDILRVRSILVGKVQEGGSGNTDVNLALTEEGL